MDEKNDSINSNNDNKRIISGMIEEDSLMPSSQRITFDDLMIKAKEYLHFSHNLEMIEKAYLYAKRKHEGQFRKSGDPYIQHPLEVAYLLTTLHSSPETICAGFLHDVLEDTDVTKEEMISEFGEDIYSIVEGVTKISKLKYMTKEKVLAKTHQKILLAMAKDIRVVLVKLLDRVHNMRTLEFQPVEKQRRIAQETLDLYAPLAHRLGMYRIKAELEDLSFKYTENEKYNEITKDIELQKINREEDIQKMQLRINDILDKAGIHNFTIKGRVKNIFSINKKMINKDLTFEQIYDLMALRVIVPTVTDCYHVLGLIHAEWKPLPGRFKDYISTPKPNLYQSLHTTVLGIYGKIFEVQIRTFEMDDVAENGIAAHWAYKEDNRNYTPQKEQEELVSKLKWYKDLLSYAEQGENDDEDPLLPIKEDIFSANVYVFTPRGDVFDFPNGATPLDFAYRVHTEVGNHTIGAIINNRIVPLTYHLKTGDVIEIKTSKSFNGPSESWLRIVKTSHARHKIISLLNKKKREELVERGREDFEKALKANNLTIKLEDKIVKENFVKLSVNNLEDFYYILGKGEISVGAAINKLLGRNEKISEESMIKHYQDNESRFKKHKGNDFGIYVEGLPKAQIKLASCCMPVYGDQIIGYVTKGNGIIVHRFDCHNVSHSIEERFIDVYWGELENPRMYDTIVNIHSFDRKNIVADVINVINSCNNVIILSINSTSKKGSDLLTKVKLSINNVQNLENVITNIQKITDVYTTERGQK